MNGGSCLAVMYHYVRDGAATRFPAIRALPPDYFRQQLDWLQRTHRLISIAEFEQAMLGRGTLPAGAAILTFDDGFVDHYETVLPELQRRGLDGVFFLSHGACAAPQRVLGVHKTHFLIAALGAEAFGREVWRETRVAGAGAGAAVFGRDSWDAADERAVKNLLNVELSYADADRVLDALFAQHLGDESEFARGLYLDETMVRAMSQAGMTFGYHTRSHRMLSRLSAADQSRELADGVGWIRELTGQERVPFCYPWGGLRTYTDETRGLLAQHGYALAFNTVRRLIEPGRDGRYELPRIDTRDLPPYSSGVPVEDTVGTGEA